MWPDLDVKRKKILTDLDLKNKSLEAKVKELEESYPKFTALENVEMSEKIEHLEALLIEACEVIKFDPRPQAAVFEEKYSEYFNLKELEGVKSE